MGIYEVPPPYAPFPWNPYNFLPEVDTKLQVWSGDVRHGVMMPRKHASDIFGVPGGQDMSPEILWGPPPADTKSFVVTCYDPDAPTVSGFWHWTVIDIPSNVRGLPTDAGNPDRTSELLPTGAIMLKNDAGFNGYVGAGPPQGHGSHRYMFAVSAMPVEKLGIEASTSAAVSQFYMYNIGVLGRGIITPIFELK